MNKEILEAFAKETKEAWDRMLKERGNNPTSIAAAYNIAQIKYLHVAKIAKQFDPLFDIFAFEKACGFNG